MELVKNIAAAVGCVLSLISLITLCTKGGRKFIANLFKRNTSDLQAENARQSQEIQELQSKLDQVLDHFGALEEVSMQQCRNTIKNIYYKYQKTKLIPLYERKTVDRTYEIYRDCFHGNSYASLLYQEICKWDIDTVTYQELCDDIDIRK